MDFKAAENQHPFKKLGKFYFKLYFIYRIYIPQINLFDLYLKPKVNMKCGFSFLWLFILSISLIGQSNSLKPNLLIKEARNNYKQVDVDLFKLSADRNIVEIPKEIKEYSILSLDKRAVQSFSKSRSPFISMKIPQHGRNDITLELIEVNPFSEDFVLRTAPSMQIVSVNHGKHYRGIIKGQDRSIAAISVFDDQIVGMVSHPSATGNLVIGKLDNTDQHIMYQDDQISDKKNYLLSDI
jgi:hypothetical protein